MLPNQTNVFGLKSTFILEYSLHIRGHSRMLIVKLFILQLEDFSMETDQRFLCNIFRMSKS